MNITYPHFVQQARDIKFNLRAPQKEGALEEQVNDLFTSALELLKQDQKEAAKVSMVLSDVAVLCESTARLNLRTQIEQFIKSHAIFDRPKRKLANKDEYVQQSKKSKGPDITREQSSQELYLEQVKKIQGEEVTSELRGLLAKETYSRLSYLNYTSFLKELPTQPTNASGILQSLKDSVDNRVKTESHSLTGAIEHCEGFLERTGLYLTFNDLLSTSVTGKPFQQVYSLSVGQVLIASRRHFNVFLKRIINSKAPFHNLKKLKVTMVDIHDSELVFISKVCPNLDCLTLIKCNKITKKLFTTLKENCQNLTRLCLSKNATLEYAFINTAKVRREFIFALRALPLFRHLELPEWECFTPQDLQEITKLKLQTLDLSETLLTDGELIEIGKMTDLETLNISSCIYLTDEGLEALSPLVNLRNLDLSSNRIKDPAISIIAKHKQLRVLNLAHNSRVCGDTLSDLYPLKHLQILNLAGLNRVPFQELCKFKTLSESSSLEVKGLNTKSKD